MGDDPQVEAVRFVDISPQSDGGQHRGWPRTIAVVASVDVPWRIINAVVAYRDSGGVVVNMTYLSLDDIQERANEVRALERSIEEEEATQGKEVIPCS